MNTPKYFRFTKEQVLIFENEFAEAGYTARPDHDDNIWEKDGAPSYRTRLLPFPMVALPLGER